MNSRITLIPNSYFWILNHLITNSVSWIQNIFYPDSLQLCPLTALYVIRQKLKFHLTCNRLTDEFERENGIKSKISPHTVNINSYLYRILFLSWERSIRINDSSIRMNAEYALISATANRIVQNRIFIYIFIHSHHLKLKAKRESDTAQYNLNVLANTNFNSYKYMYTYHRRENTSEKKKTNYRHCTKRCCDSLKKIYTYSKQSLAGYVAGVETFPSDVLRGCFEIRFVFGARILKAQGVIQLFKTILSYHTYKNGIKGRYTE